MVSNRERGDKLAENRVFIDLLHRINMQSLDVSVAGRARKCLTCRERIRTCARFATLKKVRMAFFNVLLDPCLRRYRRRRGAGTGHRQGTLLIPRRRLP